MGLSRLAAVVLAMMLTGCAMHATPIIAPTRYLVPLYLPGDDQLCVQQPSGKWSCIHLEDLRKLLGSMGAA